MSKPIVAIIGRPNVGKSTFFNKITGKKISIVKDRPGVTRDRIYADAEWSGYNFTLVDTGGLEVSSEDEMYTHIKKQAEIAISISNCILFFTDYKTGVTPQDEEIAMVLRKSKKPVILVVNKADNFDMNVIYEFYNLGLGEPFGVSSEHSKGFGDLLDAIVETFVEGRNTDDAEDVGIKIAVVGKPNAGKSSLVNKLLGVERTIVSDIAGTTRDAIDTPFYHDEKKYTIIDTAGIRKKRSVDDDVEYYSVLRSLGAIRRADVCVLMIDSEHGITEQDVKIAGYIHEQGKPSVIVMNKWDIIKKDTHTINEFDKKLKEELKFMDYFVSLYISAKTGQRVDKILNCVDYVYNKSTTRIATGILNDMLGEAVSVTEPPSKGGRRLKLYFVTQVSVAPPTFVFKVNDIQLAHFSYQRFLENYIRKTFSLDGTPIRLIFRNRDDKED